MPQRKRKKIVNYNNKVSKAHHKNEFLKKFKYLINSCSGENIYSLIPRKEQDIIYAIRFYSIKVISEKGLEVPNSVIEVVKWALNLEMKRVKVKLNDMIPEMYIADWMTVGMTVITYKSILAEGLFPGVEKLMKALEDFPDYTDVVEAVWKSVFNCLLNIDCYISNSNSVQYWLEFAIEERPENTFCRQNLVILHGQKPETIQVLIDGNPRPATRLGFGVPNTGVDWVFLKASELNYDGPFTGLQLPVYFQSHALKRLYERLDSLTESMSHFLMNNSFKEAKIIFDHENRPLLECSIGGIKVGYFRIEIIDGIVLIKTFLFLTNNGTPEGLKLEKLTGLKKLDRKYLAIDKMSTFLSSNIGQDPDINKLLIDSGCESLVALYNDLSKVLKTPERDNLSEKIKKYLTPILPEQEALSLTPCMSSTCVSGGV